jgi:hypothetical protein
LPKRPPEFSPDIVGEAHLFSFIVRIWAEGLDSPDRLPIWRGHVTAIPEGERHYFTNINEIPDLIMAHLKSQI